MSITSILKRRYEKYGMVASIIYIIPSKYTDTEGFFVCRLGYKMYDGFDLPYISCIDYHDNISNVNSQFKDMCSFINAHNTMIDLNHDD